MKTAESWFFELHKTRPANSTEDLIKQIQLDAMREGARRSAEKIRPLGIKAEDWQDCRIIIDASNQWTEKDL